MRGNFPVKLNPCYDFSVLARLYRKSSPELLAEGYLLIKDLAEQVVSKVTEYDTGFPHDIAVRLSYRIAERKFRPPSGVGPLKGYLRRALFSDTMGNKVSNDGREVSFSVSMFDSFLAGEDPKLDRKMDGELAVAQILKGLREFYSMESIRTNLPLAVVCYRDKASVVEMDVDFREFYLTFEFILRKVKEANEFGKFFIGATRIDDATKSIIAALVLRKFLADKMDSHLAFALDFNSLFRLVQSVGGESIRVPEMKVLNEVMARARLLPEYLFGNYVSISNLRGQNITGPLDLHGHPKKALGGESLSDSLRKSLKEIPLEEYIGIVIDTLITLLGEMVEVLRDNGKVVSDDRYLLVTEEVCRLICLLNKAVGKTVTSSVELMLGSTREGKAIHVEKDS
jgi:hypothetical protein